MRLGVKKRDQALRELDDKIDVRNVYRILNEIEYDEDAFFADTNAKQLVVYYTSGKTLTSAELKSWLARFLPDAMIPSYFVQLGHFRQFGKR